MKKYIFLIFFLSLITKSHSQRVDTVFVFDEVTKKPIQGVHIYSTPFEGSITNELGQAIISSIQRQKFDSIFISCIGYKSLKATYKNLGMNISLKPDIKLLSEVLVTPFIAKDTVVKVLNLLKINHNQEGNHFALYRDIHFQNDTLRRVSDVDLKYQINNDSKKEIIIRNVFRRNNSFFQIFVSKLPHTK